jgi:serine/threonine-protein kinase
VPHPNIVPVFEVGEEAGTPFFSMEYAPGGTLADRVRITGRLPPAEAAAAIAAVAAGVDRAHKADVLHRDLKPSNVLLAADGTPKVADFGLAKLLDRDDGPTHGGSVVGTPSYMAPEQVDPRFGPVGPRTDVYGLGATLYHLLTGRPPFNAGESPIQTVQQVTTDEPPGVRAESPEVDAVLDAIVRRAMAKQPSDRYPTAAALADDLTAWAVGRSTVARPRTRGETARRWAWRHRLKLVAAMLPLLAAAAAFAKRESDPARQIERALARGDAVTVIGATGPPRWSDWALNPGTPAESPRGDGTFYFQTHEQSLLTLVPDPMQERYTFAADVRQLSRGADPRNSVGVFLGLDSFETDTGLPATRWLLISYCEFLTPQQMNNPDLRAGLGVETTSFVAARPPGTIDGTRCSYSRRLHFEPANDSAGGNVWRTIVAVASPDGVAVYFRTGDGPLEPAARVTAPRIRDVMATHNKGLDLKAAAYRFPLREWRPRGALGLWASDTSVAFRNVRVEPSSRDDPQFGGTR